MRPALVVLRVLVLCLPWALALGLRLWQWRRPAPLASGPAADAGKQERRGTTVPRTVAFAAVLALILVLCLPLLSVSFGSLDLAGPWLLLLAVGGLVLVGAGTAVGVWARATLGASWSTAPKANVSRALVTAGPYAWVRHPVYLGFFLGLAGIALAFASWLALLICLVWLLPALLWRARVEERLLADVYGDEYLQYRQRTRLLLPGLW